MWLWAVSHAVRCPPRFREPLSPRASARRRRRREAMELRPRRAKRARSIEPESDDEGSKVVIVGPPSELERTKKRLEATRAKLARTEATLKTTEATLALKTKALDSFLRPQPVAFDVDGNVACVVMSHVSDVKTRLALAQVGKVWRRASKEAASLPASLDFSRCRGPECTTYAKVDHLLDINGLDKLTEARFMSLLRDDAGSHAPYRVFLGRAPLHGGAGQRRRSSALKALSPQAIAEPNTSSVDATAVVMASGRTWSWLCSSSKKEMLKVVPVANTNSAGYTNSARASRKICSRRSSTGRRPRGRIEAAKEKLASLGHRF